MIPRAGAYDKNLFLKKQLISHYYDLIKPEAVEELYNERTSYEYVKEVAAALLEKSLMVHIDIIPLDTECDYNLENLSNNVFSWSHAEYLKRRQLPDCVWADVLQIQSTEHCLDKFKLQVDLAFVKKYLKFILQTLQKPKFNYDLNFLVWNPLLEAERGLNMLAILDEENELIKEKFEESERFTEEMIKARRHSKERNILREIEELLLQAQTIEPIVTRYRINWHECKAEQARIANDIKESTLHKTRANYKNQAKTEEIAGNTIRDTYYALTEQYKQEIETLQNRFNVRLDDYENKINYTQLEITKVRDRQKALRKQIETFHKEIELRLAKEQREFERLQLLQRRSTIKSLKRFSIKKAKEKDKTKKGNELKAH